MLLASNIKRKGEILKMRNTKTQKGITLVALVITIIVLLILAAVAIGAIQNKGIIKYAQNASADYEVAEKEEQSVLASLLDKIKEKAPGNSGEGSKSEEDNTQVSKLGKYVRYDVDGDGVIETDNEYEAILWRVLRDDDDKVELITANALGELDLGSSTSYSAGKTKYNNAVELMVAECKRVTGIQSNIRNVGGPATEEPQTGDRSGDENYVEDFGQMEKIGLTKAEPYTKDDYREYHRKGILACITRYRWRYLQLAIQCALCRR